MYRTNGVQNKVQIEVEFVVGHVTKAETSHRVVPDFSPFGGTLVAKLTMEGIPLACCTPISSQVSSVTRPQVMDEGDGHRV